MSQFYFIIALILAAFWGTLWACALQLTATGRFLAIKRTWITVVIGVGVDLIILLLILDVDQWWRTLAVIAISSVGIIIRSLLNERRDVEDQIEAFRSATRQVEDSPGQ